MYFKQIYANDILTRNIYGKIFLNPFNWPKFSMKLIRKINLNIRSRHLGLTLILSVGFAALTYFFSNYFPIFYLKNLFKFINENLENYFK